LRQFLTGGFPDPARQAVSNAALASDAINKLRLNMRDLSSS
jgi:hypothetical protein